MRLEREGYAERETKRKYQLDKKIPKKVLKAARARSLGRASVVAGLKSATGAEQIGLRSLRHQALGGVQHLDHVLTVGGDQGDTHRRATVQVLVADLGCRDREPTLQLGDDRPDDGPLLLEGVDVAEEQVQLEPSDPHVLQHGSRPGRRPGRPRDTMGG